MLRSYRLCFHENKKGILVCEGVYHGEYPHSSRIRFHSQKSHLQYTSLHPTNLPQNLQNDPNISTHPPRSHPPHVTSSPHFNFQASSLKPSKCPSTANPTYPHSPLARSIPADQIEAAPAAAATTTSCTTFLTTVTEVRTRTNRVTGTTEVVYLYPYTAYSTNTSVITTTSTRTRPRTEVETKTVAQCYIRGQPI